MIVARFLTPDGFFSEIFQSLKLFALDGLFLERLKILVAPGGFFLAFAIGSHDHILRFRSNLFHGVKPDVRFG